MFTIEQIHEASRKVKSGADFPQLIQDLESIGVLFYDNFVANGQTKYFGANNFVIQGDSKYSPIKVNEKSSRDKLKHSISIHQKGQTDYLTFCNQAAEAGVEKWRTNIKEMTVTYFDKKGNEMTVEPIPKP